MKNWNNKMAKARAAGLKDTTSNSSNTNKQS